MLTAAFVKAGEAALSGYARRPCGPIFGLADQGSRNRRLGDCIACVAGKADGGSRKRADRAPAACGSLGGKMRCRISAFALIPAPRHSVGDPTAARRRHRNGRQTMSCGDPHPQYPQFPSHRLRVRWTIESLSPTRKGRCWPAVSQKSSTKVIFFRPFSSPSTSATERVSLPSASAHHRPHRWAQVQAAVREEEYPRSETPAGSDPAQASRGSALPAMTHIRSPQTA